MPDLGEQLLRTIGPPPPEFGRGSQLEWLVFWLLTQLGQVFGIDFVHQYPIRGGRLVPNGLIPDFFFPEQRMVWLIQGIHYHYRTYYQEAETRYQIADYISLDYLVVVLDEDRLLENPYHIVREALQGISHSRLNIT